MKTTGRKRYEQIYVNKSVNMNITEIFEKCLMKVASNSSENVK